MAKIRHHAMKWLLSAVEKLKKKSKYLVVVKRKMRSLHQIDMVYLGVDVASLFFAGVYILLIHFLRDI